MLWDSVSQREAVNQAASVGHFFIQLCTISTLLSLVDIALGIFHSSDRMRRVRSISQLATYTFGFILFVLTVTAFAKNESFLTQWYKYVRDRDSDSDIYEPDENELRPFTLLGVSCDILLFVAYLAQLALSIFVVVASRKVLAHRQVRRSSEGL